MIKRLPEYISKQDALGSRKKNDKYMEKEFFFKD